MKRQTYLGQKRQLKSRVRLDEVNEVLCAQATQELPYIRSYEKIIHDGLAVVCGDELHY